ncbi:hypothetical protein KM043_000348 [Ampulex compressa]|nr:hypothetical protein KM043_000348 [Ampulex compressa]
MKMYAADRANEVINGTCAPEIGAPAKQRNWRCLRSSCTAEQKAKYNGERAREYENPGKPKVRGLLVYSFAERTREAGRAEKLASYRPAHQPRGVALVLLPETGA